MAGVYGNGIVPLRYFVLSADLTLSFYDVIRHQYNTLINSGSDAWTLTLPTPAKDLCNYPFYVANTSSGVFTLSCSSGFMDGGSTFVISAGDSAQVRCMPTGSGTFAWSVQGAGQAVVGLTEAVFAVFAAAVTGNTETGITLTAQQADNTLDAAIDDSYITTLVEGMVSGNTETGITVTGAAGKLNFAVTAASGFDYVKTGLTGGTATDLDGIDGAGLVDGDTALVVVGNAPGIAYIYVLDDDGAAGESSPTVIVPDTNPGTLNWVLASIKTLSTDITDFAEAVQDALEAPLVTNATHVGITATYTDGTDSMDLAVQYGTEPGAVATSTSGQAGSADTASRSDHNHDLGAHTHADATVGGTITSASVSDFAEAVMDALEAPLVTNATHTGITATYTDGTDSMDLAVQYGTSAATACVGNDARLPVDVAVFAPSVVWTGGAPASVAEVYRYQKTNDWIEGYFHISTADGDGKTPVSISMPETPADVDAKIHVNCTQVINGTPTSPYAYIDAADATPANRLLKFEAASAWTDGTACEIYGTFRFEV